jgi:hypothetical protein
MWSGHLDHPLGRFSYFIYHLRSLDNHSPRTVISVILSRGVLEELPWIRPNVYKYRYTSYRDQYSHTIVTINVFQIQGKMFLKISRKHSFLIKKTVKSGNLPNKFLLSEATTLLISNRPSPQYLLAIRQCYFQHAVGHQFLPYNTTRPSLNTYWL